MSEPDLSVVEQAGRELARLLREMPDAKGGTLTVRFDHQSVTTDVSVRVSRNVTVGVWGTLRRGASAIAGQVSARWGRT